MIAGLHGTWAEKGLLLVVMAAPIVGCSSPNDNGATHPAGTQIANVTLNARPFGVAVSPGGQALVSRLDAGIVSRYAIDPDQFQADVAVGSVPTDVSMNPSGTVAFVTNQGSGTVGFIDVSAGAQTAAVAVPANTFRVVSDLNGGRVYVSTNSTRLYVIDAAARRVVDSIHVPTDINGLAVAPNGTTLFATSPTAGSVARIDLATRTVAQVAGVAGAAQEIVVSPSGDEIYIANLGGGVEVRRASDLGLITTIAGSEGGFGMALSPDGEQLWVTITLSSKIVVIDRASRTVAATIPTGGMPRRIRFSKKGDIAVIADEAGRVLFIR